jgi:N6-adenosine-specific RNA methylase IME4
LRWCRRETAGCAKCAQLETSKPAAWESGGLGTQCGTATPRRHSMNGHLISDSALARNTARRDLAYGFILADAPSADSGDVAGAVLIPSPPHYGVICADPPWPFATYSHKGKGRSAEAHYDCMGLDEIKAMPVAGWAAGDCALFLWATDPLLPRAFEVIAAWGFVYKTVAFTWAKTTKDGTGFPIGCGFWTRANPELCLLATRGRPQRISRSVRQLILAPRRAHPQKPDEVYERIESLVPGPYLELFARKRRPG